VALFGIHIGWSRSCLSGKTRDLESGIERFDSPRVPGFHSDDIYTRNAIEDSSIALWYEPNCFHNKAFATSPTRSGELIIVG
jgi:hypothetical protein